LDVSYVFDVSINKTLKVLITVLPSIVRAEENNATQLYYKNSEMLSIASGRPTPTDISPGVTSVLTSKDIENIGARRITDVLEYLPGVHVSQSRAGNNVISFRGIEAEGNQQVLVMINGTPIRNAFLGSKSYLWDTPVKDISQIEVIRGPGSMLYGADATSGVINIILKTGKEINGGNAGSFVGSQDTYEGWFQTGRKNDTWGYAFSAQGGSTSGNKGKIEQDAQTSIDQLFGTHASNAPGYTNNGREDIDLRADISYNDLFHVRAGYQRFSNVQNNQGIAFALDKLGKNQVDIYTMDATLSDQISDSLSADFKYYFYGEHDDLESYLLPPGTFGGALPQGARAMSTGFVGTTGATTQLNYTGITNHHVTGGSGLIYNWTSSATNKANFEISQNSVRQIPLTNTSDLASDAVSKQNQRYNAFALLQDEWNFKTDWYLTYGARYDYFSDVENYLSPRAALVWNINRYFVTKLLYGRAFRAPAFYEINQAQTQGISLKPEKSETFEVQVENRWSEQLKSSVNAYWFNFDNLITSSTNISLSQYSPVGFFNNKRISGVGVEMEANYRPVKNFTMSISYSYHGIDSSNNTGLLPEHMAKSLMNWELSDVWRVGSQLSWVGERRRGANDPRHNLEGYFVFGLTVSAKIVKALEITVRGNNLLDTNAKEPSLNSSLLPGDIPVSGRSVLGQIKYSF
jgi:iron complex outermembrane receptor protein